MKRLFAIAFVTMLCVGAAAVPGVASAANHDCSTHGYSHSYCQYVPGGEWVGFHVPGYKHSQLEFYIKSHVGGLDIEIESVSCPGTPPAHATCFSMDFFKHSNGQPVYRVGQPVYITGTSSAYRYVPSTGKWKKMSGHTNYPGVFAIVPH